MESAADIIEGRNSREQQEAEMPLNVSVQTSISSLSPTFLIHF